MTTDEFSAEFDEQISSYIASNKFGNSDLKNLSFNEYEKSLFLTSYQEMLVQSLYNGKNEFSESFEDTEELRKKLNSLVLTIVLTTLNTTATKLNTSNSIYTLPTDLWFIVYEQVLLSGKIVNVIPTTHNDYIKIVDNPFKGPSSSRVLRLDNGANTVELVANTAITSYTVRYIKRPNPIILIDLPDSLSIGGISVKTECELNESIHRDILRGAVRMALQSRMIVTPTNK